GQVAAKLVQRGPFPGAGEVLPGDEEPAPVDLEETRGTVEPLLQPAPAVEVTKEAQPATALHTHGGLAILLETLVVEPDQGDGDGRVRPEEVELGLAGNLVGGVEHAPQTGEGFPAVDRGEVGGLGVPVVVAGGVEGLDESQRAVVAGGVPPQSPVLVGELEVDG